MPRFYVIFGLSALAIVLALTYRMFLPAPAKAEDIPQVAFFHEFFGLRGYSDPQVEQNLRLGMMNGLTFSPPVEDGAARATEVYGAGLMLRLPGITISPGASDVEQQRLEFNRLASAAAGLPMFWNLMPEWDQSGGSWVSRGRPRYNGLSRAEADARFLSYYQTTFPLLIHYLRQPSDERKYRLAAVTDHAPNVYRAYEMGVELQMLERGIDELGDLSTGIAFLRGAARQYGRAWGVDFSSWRSSTDGATSYNDSGTLLRGWSDSYLRRHYFAAFAAGARNLLNEATTYRYTDGRLNPFGQATQEFADFALRRHPEVAQPAVSMALLIDHHTGFDPKHGVYNQRNQVWYQDIPYSDGDYMMDNFFRLAFPGHWLHGLAPQAPFADLAGVPNGAKFRAFLAAGGDSRPYEPMPTTRWGDNLDVVTNTIPAAALSNYKVVVMIGDVTLDPPLRNSLQAWVERGGILVMNVAQATYLDEELTGVTLPVTPMRQAAFSRWLPSLVGTVEATYSYRFVRPTTAEVLAVNETQDPLVTRRRLGTGEVWLTSPDHLQTLARDQILQVGVQVLDSLFSRFTPARVKGPSIEYVVSEASGKVVVTLINSSGSEWIGDVIVRRPGGFSRVMEYLSDKPAGFSSTRREVTVPVRIPAYDLRIVAVEYAPSSVVPTAALVEFKR